MMFIDSIKWTEFIAPTITFIVGVILSFVFKTLIPNIFSYLLKLFNGLIKYIKLKYTILFKWFNFYYLLMIYSDNIFYYSFQIGVGNFRVFRYKELVYRVRIVIEDNNGVVVKEKTHYYLPFIYCDESFRRIIYPYLLILNKKYKKSYVNTKDFDEKEKLKDFLFKNDIL